MALRKALTVKDTHNVIRTSKTQEQLNNTTNKSTYDLSKKKLLSGTYFRKNFSWSNFDKTNLTDCIFIGCNFSFAENMNKTIKDKVTDFVECNFSGIPLDELPMSAEALKAKGNNINPNAKMEIL